MTEKQPPNQRRRTHFMAWRLLWNFLLAVAPVLAADKIGQKDNQRELDQFIAAARNHIETPVTTAGSLWNPQSPLAGAALDLRARRANDVILIRIVEQTRAEAAGSVQSQRNLQASSGIANLLGPLGERSGLRGLFSPSSESSLNGQAQTASSTLLTTTLAGHVVEVLPNGLLVIEAVRGVEMNNERQTVLVRGIVRAEDVGADNSVNSTVISHLEIQLKGKGVISDGVRPPHMLMRILMRVLGF